MKRVRRQGSVGVSNDDGGGKGGAGSKEVQAGDGGGGEGEASERKDLAKIIQKTNIEA